MPDTSPSSGIQVVVTAQTASAWGLRPGSQVAVIAPLQTTISGNGPPSPSFRLNLDVTGIVEPTDPDSSFWKADPLLAAPNLYVSQSKLWEGAFIADPGEITMMQEIFGHGGPEHPVGVSGGHSRAARPGPGSVQRDEAVHAPDSPADRAPSPDVQRAEHVVCPARSAGDACRGLEWGERPVVDGLCGPGGGGRRDDASRGPDGRGPPVRGDGHAAGTWSVTGAPVLARVLRRGGGRRAGRRAGLGARRAPRPWPRPHRLGRLVAGHRDAGSRRIGSRGGGGLAAPPAARAGGPWGGNAHDGADAGQPE